MSIRRIVAVAVAVCAVVFTILLAPSVKADSWNRKTYVTFNQSVEIPGSILPPGHYVVKLADLASDRHVVQVLSGNERQVISTFIALPTYAPEPYDATVFTYEERPGDQPQAIHAWYYPGDACGNEFVYWYSHPYTESAASSNAYR